jgi:thioredoxin 1
MKKIILSIAAATFFLVSCHQSVTGNFASVDPKHFASIADSLNDEQLIDVRTPAEYASGHIEGAKNIDWNGESFSTEAAALDKTKPVMVYCLSGGRSTEAAEWLRKEGFQKVYEMKTGIAGWKSENLPLTAETKTAQAPAAQSSEVTTAAFRSLVNSQSVVLVDFAATWCGPCKRLSPRLDELEKEMGDKFKLVKLDSDRDNHLADSMNITALPTLMLYKDGKIAWRNEGLVDKEVVADQIKKAAGK